MEWDRGEALITAKGQREKPIYRRLVLEMREMKSSRLSGLSTAALNALTGSVLRFSMFLTKVFSQLRLWEFPPEHYCKSCLFKVTALTARVTYLMY